MVDISKVLSNSLNKLFGIGKSTGTGSVVKKVGNSAEKIASSVKKGKASGISKLPAYVKSSGRTSAEKAYAEWKSSMPAAPKLSYTSEINSLLETLAGRSFSYDHTTDPAYIAEKNALSEQGRLAMEDTLGAANAKTGGYTNSYAVSSANQAYNNYVSKIGDVIPELYESAYNRYTDETDELYDRVKLLSSLNDDEWSRYSDALSAYYDEGKLLLDELERATDTDLAYYKLLVSNI